VRAAAADPAPRRPRRRGLQRCLDTRPARDRQRVLLWTEISTIRPADRARRARRRPRAAQAGAKLRFAAGEAETWPWADLFRLARVPVAATTCCPPEYPPDADVGCHPPRTHRNTVSWPRTRDGRKPGPASSPIGDAAARGADQTGARGAGEATISARRLGPRSCRFDLQGNRILCSITKACGNREAQRDPQKTLYYGRHARLTEPVLGLGRRYRSLEYLKPAGKSAAYNRTVCFSLRLLCASAPLRLGCRARA
jgi:hypothetical protein